MKRNSNKVWETLTVADILLTVFLFWILYSQLSYLTTSLQENRPIIIPDLTSYTTVIKNPLTGRFFFVPSYVTFYTFFASLAVILVIYFFFRRL